MALYLHYNILRGVNLIKRVQLIKTVKLIPMIKDKVTTGIIRKNTVTGAYALSDKSRIIIFHLIVKKGVENDNKFF